MATRVAADQGAMGAAGEALRQLAGHVNALLKESQNLCRNWRTVSWGPTAATADAAIVYLEDQQNRISQFAVAYGSAVDGAGQSFMAADRRLASGFSLG